MPPQALSVGIDSRRKFIWTALKHKWASTKPCVRELCGYGVSGGGAFDGHGTIRYARKCRKGFGLLRTARAVARGDRAIIQ